MWEGQVEKDKKDACIFDEMLSSGSQLVYLVWIELHSYHRCYIPPADMSDYIILNIHPEKNPRKRT